MDTERHFRIDLHVHTKRYSPCAETLDPEELGEEMVRKGLSGLVLSEHDEMWSKEEVRELTGPFSDAIKIYRGVEISSCDGHFVVIGLNDLAGLQPGVSIEKIIAVAQLQNAAVILAHPQRNVKKTCGGAGQVHWPSGINAVEVMSTLTKNENEIVAREIAAKSNWSMVAGSDAHSLANVGATYTVFDQFPENEKELARMIISGRGLARRRKP
jgi:predicted metal-dependent phosphoesterase TrpH